MTLDNPSEEQLALKPISPYDAKNNTPILQQKEFNQTWLEFAAQKFQQVKLTGYAQNSTTTIYTIPEGYIFYLTSAQVSYSSIGGGAATSNLYYYYFGSGANNRIGNSGFLANNIVSTNLININFPMSIQMRSGEQIIISSASAQIYINLSFQGFLVPFSV